MCIRDRIDTEFFKIGPSAPRRNFFHHKSYSFLSRTFRLTNSNPKALLLGCRGTLAQNRGTMGGYKYHSHSPKALILSHFRQKYRFCRGIQIVLLSLFCFSLFCPGMPCFARGSGVMVKCSEITDCGKSEQNWARCYYLLVVKLVVKETFLLLRIYIINVLL